MISFLYAFTFTMCLGLLCHFIFLRTTKHFAFQRSFLLGTLALAVTTTLLGSFGEQLFSTSQILEITLPSIEINNTLSSPTVDTYYRPINVLLVVYVIGVLVTITLLLKQFWEVYRVGAFAVISKKPNFNIVESTAVNAPFSFFNNLYINPAWCFSSSEKRMIIEHEKTHIQLGHTYDRLIVSVMKIFLWFHPLIWILERELILVHEYQVDDRTVQQLEMKPYATFLLNQAFLIPQKTITNQIFSHHLKKRINMMTQKSQNSTVKLFFSLLILAASPFIFSACTEEVENRTEENPINLSNEIFKVVEKMPTFKGCDETLESAEFKKCATKNLLQFVYTNIKYPEVSRDNGVEGTALVRFVVDKEGKVTSPEIIKSVSPDIDAEVLRIMNLMPDWNPGEQEGKRVSTYFNLPVKFKLQ